MGYAPVETCIKFRALGYEVMPYNKDIIFLYKEPIFKVLYNGSIEYSKEMKKFKKIFVSRASYKDDWCLGVKIDNTDEYKSLMINKDEINDNMYVELHTEKVRIYCKNSEEMYIENEEKYNIDSLLWLSVDILEKPLSFVYDSSSILDEIKDICYVDEDNCIISTHNGHFSLWNRRTGTFTRKIDDDVKNIYHNVRLVDDYIAFLDDDDNIGVIYNSRFDAIAYEDKYFDMEALRGQVRGRLRKPDVHFDKGEIQLKSEILYRR